LGKLAPRGLSLGFGSPVQAEYGKMYQARPVKW
jgi:hypothetical protein